MKITRLLDPTASAGGAPTVAAPAPTQVTGTGFQPAPNVEETVAGPDPFLADDTKPNPEAKPVNTTEVKPATDSVVVDPAAPVVPALAPAAPTTYTPEQVAALLKSNTPAPAAVPAPPPKQLTQAEIDAQLNTYVPTESDVNALLGGGPEAVAKFTEMASKLVKNAVTVASIIAKEEMRKMDATYQPHIAFAQEQQRVYAQQQYFTDNPTHVGLEPLVAQVAQQMQSEGFKGTPAATFKEVGKRVDSLVEKLKISRPAAGATTTVAPAATVPAPTRMSTVSTGGQGGAGGAGSSSAGKDPEAGIWS